MEEINQTIISLAWCGVCFITVLFIISCFVWGVCIWNGVCNLWANFIYLRKATYFLTILTIKKKEAKNWASGQIIDMLIEVCKENPNLKSNIRMVFEEANEE